MARGAVFVMCVAFVGCRVDSGLSTDARFTGTEPLAATDGVLLVGMRLARPVRRNGLLYTYTPGAFFRMSLRGLDTANHLTANRRIIQVCDLIAAELGALSACDPTIMSYRVIRLPAGRYVLEYFSMNEHKRSSTTNFVGGKEISPVYGLHGLGPVMPSQLIVIDIAPGQITYIGEFNWDAQPFPAAFVMTRDDNAARAALSAYPGITAPLVFHPVIQLPVPAYPPQD